MPAPRDTMPRVSSAPPTEPPPPLLDAAPVVAPSRAATVRFGVWAALVVAIGAGNLAFAAGQGRHPVTLAITLWPALGLAVLAVGALLATTPPDAIRLSRRRGEAIVLLGTVVMAGAAWARFSPALSSDMLRYRLDGEITLAGGSPWAVTPEEWRNAHGYFNHTSDPYLDSATPFPQVKSIYPPAAQALFAAAAKLATALPQPAGGGLPLRASIIWSSEDEKLVAPHAAVLRAAAAASVVGTTAVLLRALRRMGRSPWYAVLFAWSPLVVVESAGQGHVDAFGATFLAVAVALAAGGRLPLAAVALAVAAGVKPHVAAVAPVLVAWAWQATAGHPRRWRRPAAVAAAFAVTLLAIYAPLLLSPENWRGWRQTVDVYAMSWEANGSIYELICWPFRDGDGRALADAKIAARVVGGVGALLALYLAIRNRLPPADAAYWLTLVPLLLAPVVYPWYLIWGLAMVPLMRRSGGWTLITWAATSGLSYQLWNEPAWRLPGTWAFAQYAPVYAALAWELWSLRRPWHGRGFTAPAR